MRFENHNGKATFNGKEIKSPLVRLLFGIFCVLFSALIVSVILAVLLPVFGISVKLTMIHYIAFVVGVLVIIPTILAGSLVTGIVSGSIDIFSSSKS
ncbi:MAG: hypothetical protein WCS44_08580, partial [Bacillota bacterium]